MKIEFTSPEITQFANGNDVFINDGKPIPVTPGQAAAFLSARARIGKEMVNVFQAVESGEVSTPTETPTVASLSKDHTREELQEMAKQLGLDGDDYTNKTELATAILAAKGE